MKKQKRNWSPEQRAAAAARMKAWHDAQKPGQDLLAGGTAIAVTSGVEVAAFIPPVVDVGVEDPAIRSPEVQAVLDTMDPVRKARLAAVQARVWQDNGRADGKAAAEAVARHEAEKAAADPYKAAVMQNAPQRDEGRVGSREVSLIVKTNGIMVSQWGPCVCGKAKREWHAICLKEGA